MKAYVWEYTSDVTTNYHSGGGLLIVTERDPQQVWDEYRTEPIDDYYADNELTVELPAPDLIYEVTGDAEEKLVVFPDSGCC